MANQNGNSKRKKPERTKLTYFYINGELHKQLAKPNRGKDQISTWNYPQGRRVVYVYTDVLKRHEPAFKTKDVCEMVQRSRRTIEDVLAAGHIERPQRIYTLDERRKPYAYYWSEKDILSLLDYLGSLHLGRPRKDGEVVPRWLPTPSEVRAMIRNEEVIYVKKGDNFVPTWRATEI